MEEQVKDIEINEVEEQAKAMGWKPLEEFEGDPEKHIPAEKYVKRGLERLPLLQKNYTEQQKEMQRMQRELDAQREYTKSLADIQYKRALEDIQKKQREAVEQGDTASFDALEEKKKTIQNDFSPKEPERKQETLDRDSALALAKFQRDNKWFESDPYLRQAANFMFDDLARERPELSIAEKLQEVSRRMVSEYSDEVVKYTPREESKRLPTVEGVRTVSTQKAGKTYNDLPEDAKAACNQMLRKFAGVVDKQGKPVFTKETYVKDYFGE